MRTSSLRGVCVCVCVSSCHCLLQVVSHALSCCAQVNFKFLTTSVRIKWSRGTPNWTRAAMWPHTTSQFSFTSFSWYSVECRASVYIYNGPFFWSRVVHLLFIYENFLHPLSLFLCSLLGHGLTWTSQVGGRDDFPIPVSEWGRHWWLAFRQGCHSYLSFLAIG